MSGVVEDTADDAAISKRSAAALGYYEDPFIQFMVPKLQRRAPLINRGYFARVAALEQIALAFLRVCDGGESQIVNMGCGIDTLFFRLSSSSSSSSHPTRFVELDLPSVVTKKKATILTNCPLSDLVKAGGEIEEGREEDVFVLRGLDSGYSLCECDLRDGEGVLRVLGSVGLSFDVPTLFLSECVLVYLSPGASSGLLAALSSRFSRCAVASFEQIRPDDAFGKVMLRNLAARGAPLLGLSAHPSLPAQVRRFQKAGFPFVSALDMNDVYESVLPVPLQRNAATREMFDEIEEWRLMQGHYCITVAVKDGDHKLTPTPTREGEKVEEASKGADDGSGGGGGGGGGGEGGREGEGGRGSTGDGSEEKEHMATTFAKGHVVSEDAAGFEYDPETHPPLCAILFPPPSKK